MKRLRSLTMIIALSSFFTVAAYAQILDSKDIGVTLDRALSLAQETAAKEFSDLGNYMLYSVSPRVLQGDSKGGLFWQVTWQVKQFPPNKMIRVRVYMKDGSVASERIEAKGTEQLPW